RRQERPVRLERDHLLLHQHGRLRGLHGGVHHPAAEDDPARGLRNRRHAGRKQGAPIQKERSMTDVASADLRRDLSPDAEAPARAIPGQPDMWVLVMVEAFTFSAYFVVYIIYRMRHPELFLESQAHLSRELGVADTLILLTSSWSIARCV